MPNCIHMTCGKDNQSHVSMSILQLYYFLILQNRREFVTNRRMGFLLHSVFGYFCFFHLFFRCFLFLSSIPFDASIHLTMGCTFLIAPNISKTSLGS